MNMQRERKLGMFDSSRKLICLESIINKKAFLQLDEKLKKNHGWMINKYYLFICLFIYLFIYLFINFITVYNKNSYV